MSSGIRFAWHSLVWVLEIPQNQIKQFKILQMSKQILALIIFVCFLFGWFVTSQICLNLIGMTNLVQWYLRKKSILTTLIFHQASETFFLEERNSNFFISSHKIYINLMADNRVVYSTIRKISLSHWLWFLCYFNISLFWNVFCKFKFELFSSAI